MSYAKMRDIWHVVDQVREVNGEKVLDLIGFASTVISGVPLSMVEVADVLPRGVWAV